MATDQDATIIGRASAGRALRGLSFQHDARQHGKQMLLSPPSHVFLLGPQQPALSNTYCFAASQQSISFSKDVMDKGWSFATKFHAQFFLWNATASAQGRSHEYECREEHRQQKLSQACILHCETVPVKSFQIPQSEMVLSEHALQRARAVDSVIDAQDFLQTFNPFVSQGLYHLGGIFLKEITVRLKNEASVSELLSQTQRELAGKAEANILFGGGNIDVACEGSHSTRDERRASTAASLQVEERIENVITYGPNSAQMSLEEFRQKMSLNDPSYWAIIDLDQDLDANGSVNLVPVWELLVEPSNNPLLLRHGTGAGAEDGTAFKTIAKLLCKCWLDLESRSLNHQEVHGAQAAGYDDPLYSLQPLRQRLMSKATLFLESTANPRPALPAAHSQSQRPLNLTPVDVTLAYVVQTLQEFIDSKVDKTRVLDCIQQFIRSRSLQTMNDLQDSRALAALGKWGFDMSSGIHLQEAKLDAVQVMRSIFEELSGIISFRPQSPYLQSSAAWKDLVANISELWPCDEGNPTVTLRYLGDVVVDRNNDYLLQASTSTSGHESSSRLSATQRYIDCLRHRINPREHLSSLAQSGSGKKKKKFDWDAAFGASYAAAAAAEGAPPSDRSIHGTKNSTLFEMLIHIFQHSELPVRMELCRLLLAQRASTLVVFPQASAAATGQASSDSNQRRMVLNHCIEAFCFTKVVIQDEKKLCIQNEVELPRIVFISEKEPISKSHSATVASRVMHCDFISQHDRHEMSNLGEMLPTIEVGVGFIRSEGAQPPFPCLCFHVTGPYRHRPILEFIRTIADIVVIELMKSRTDLFKQETFWAAEHMKEKRASVPVLQWQENDDDEDFDAEEMFIWGQETYIVEQIGRSLRYFARKAMSERSGSARVSLTEVCTRLFNPHLHEVINAEPLVEVLTRKSCGFSEIREKLVLQKSLVKEGEAFLASLQLIDNVSEKREKELRCDEQRKWRKEQAKIVKDLAILQVFHQILSQQTAMCRTLGIMTLENSISEGMQETLADLAKDVDRKHAAYAQGHRNDKRLKEVYLRKKQEYIDKNVGIDNLWRELCHIFEADPSRQRGLATLAAQHLLDGFPLEVFDGDAGMYCNTWVETVLTELHSTLLQSVGMKAPPKLFVLSVMGLQSSGKSTMLNLMFGTRLPTSAGRCTRGVFMQLVPSERQEYDYVLLLDTEGLRSNEFHGTEGSEVRDNRLATFGLLPADASIIMVSNEDDGALKEVLPMVLLAFKSSTMAQEYGGRMKAKTFFVYRSVDTNDKSKLKGNKQKLHENLREAAMEVSKLSGRNSNAGEGSTTTELPNNADLNLALGSDVWFMGNLKRGHIPPTDTPEWSYGKDVLRLREHIHQQVTSVQGWEATTPTTLAKQLSLVWDCICSANFELNFRDRVQYNAYMELLNELQPLKTGIAQKYIEAYNEIEKHVRSSSHGTTEEHEEKDSMVEHLLFLKASVKARVEEGEKKVREMLDHPRWAKWKASTLGEWDLSCKDLEEWYKKRVEDLVNGVLKFEKVVAYYENCCKSTIVKEIEEGKWASGMKDEQELEAIFEKFFQSIITEAEANYPRMADKVRSRVMDRYSQKGLTKQFNLFKGSSTSMSESSDSTNSGGMVKRIWNNLFSHEKPNQNEVQAKSELKAIIDMNVRDVQYFSEVVVDLVIEQTTQVINALFTNRKEKIMAHSLVIEDLVAKLTNIQRKWDVEHNVAHKLQCTSKPRLFNFFKNKARGLDATALLIDYLLNIIIDELEEAHVRAVVKVVIYRVGQEDWAMDWRQMRNLLDFHLLTLMKDIGKTKQLILYVANESNHFKLVSDALIERLIDKKLVEDEWKRLVQVVEDCFKDARSIGGEDPSLGAFIEVLHRMLADRVDPKLAQIVRTSTYNEDHFKNKDGDIVLDAEFYGKRVPDLCKSLQGKPVPDPSVHGIIKEVKNRMEGMANDHHKPKCEDTCPMCGSSCFYHLGHNGKLHDCIHQPAGLSGVRYHRSHELCERTCLEYLENNYNIIFHDGRIVPYSDFEKEFCGWKLPASTNPMSIRVRESVFFKYQQELAAHWKVRPCPSNSMPLKYNHDIEHLYTELYNKIKDSKNSTWVGELEGLFTSL